MSDSSESKKPQPAQSQPGLPGSEAEMDPPPQYVPDGYKAAGKLAGRAAIVTGGDSGIGRAVAVLFAKEGADVAIVYLSEGEDAEKTKKLVEAEGRKCLAIAGDVGDKSFCESAVKQAVDAFGRLDVLVNNAAEQHQVKDFVDIPPEQLEKTFRTNIFGYFYMAQSAVPHLPEGGSIVNTCSVTAFRGSKKLVDYSSTKGAIVAFTRALSKNLEDRKIRVNSVAPGPVWTPLIPASFPPEQVAKFGNDTHLKRPAQPGEIATAYVFLASDDGVFYTGQTMHPNGGELVGS